MAKDKSKTTNVIPDVNGSNLKTPIEKVNLDKNSKVKVVLTNKMSLDEVREILKREDVDLYFDEKEPIRIPEEELNLLLHEERLRYQTAWLAYRAVPIDEVDEDVSVFLKMSGGGFRDRLKDPFTPPRGYKHAWVNPEDMEEFKNHGYKESDSKYHLRSTHNLEKVAKIELYSMTLTKKLWEQKCRGMAKASQNRLRNVPKNLANEMNSDTVQMVNTGKLTKD